MPTYNFIYLPTEQVPQLLYVWCEDADVHAVEMPLSCASLTIKDCCRLDLGNGVYTWSGQLSSEFEMKATQERVWRGEVLGDLRNGVTFLETAWVAPAPSPTSPSRGETLSLGHAGIRRGTKRPRLPTKRSRRDGRSFSTIRAFSCARAPALARLASRARGFCRRDAANLRITAVWLSLFAFRQHSVHLSGPVSGERLGS